MNEVSVFNPIWTHSSEKEIAAKIVKNSFLSIQQFVGLGDKNRRHNTYNLPAIDFPLNFAFLASIILLLKNKKFLVLKNLKNIKIEYILTAGGIFAGLIPAILTAKGIPHFNRSYGSFVFLALTIPFFINNLSNYFKVKKELLICTLLITFATFSLFKVFYLCGRKSNLEEVFNSKQYYVAKDLKPNRENIVLDDGVNNLTIEYLKPENVTLIFKDGIEFEDNLLEIQNFSGTIYLPTNHYQIKYFNDSLQKAYENKKCNSFINNYFIKIDCEI